jgi:hypothetical protein
MAAVNSRLLAAVAALALVAPTSAFSAVVPTARGAAVLRPAPQRPVSRRARGDPSGGRGHALACPSGALCLQSAQKGQDDDAEMKSGLDKEFVSIAAPAFVQFAAEPLASLVSLSPFSEFSVRSAAFKRSSRVHATEAVPLARSLCLVFVSPTTDFERLRDLSICSRPPLALSHGQVDTMYLGRLGATALGGIALKPSAFVLASASSTVYVEKMQSGMDF